MTPAPQYWQVELHDTSLLEKPSANTLVFDSGLDHIYVSPSDLQKFMRTWRLPECSVVNSTLQCRCLPKNALNDYFPILRLRIGSFQ